MTLNRWLRGMAFASALALPCLVGCGEGDTKISGPGGGPSSGAPGSNGAASGTTGTVGGVDTGPGAAAKGGGGTESEPRRGSAATGVDNPGPK